MHCHAAALLSRGTAVRLQRSRIDRPGRVEDFLSGTRDRGRDDGGRGDGGRDRGVDGRVVGFHVRYTINTIPCTGLSNTIKHSSVEHCHISADCSALALCVWQGSADSNYSQPSSELSLDEERETNRRETERQALAQLEKARVSGAARDIQLEKARESTAAREL